MSVEELQRRVQDLEVDLCVARMNLNSVLREKPDRALIAENKALLEKIEQRDAALKRAMVKNALQVRALKRILKDFPEALTRLAEVPE